MGSALAQAVPQVRLADPPRANPALGRVGVAHGRQHQPAPRRHLRAPRSRSAQPVAEAPSHVRTVELMQRRTDAGAVTQDGASALLVAHHLRYQL